MTADSTAHHRGDALGTPAQPQGPDRGTDRVAVSPADRFVRQVRAIDAWVAARRERERRLRRPGLSRDDRMDVERQVQVLRRTHDTIKGHCARGLDREPDALRSAGPTAVLAHRQAWFRDKVAVRLDELGVTVVACTDHGAEALGAVVAEQPDLVLVGDCLAMMPGGVLLAEARRFAPSSRRAAHVSDRQQADALAADASAVFAGHDAPGFVAEALLALHLGPAAEDAER